jgi:hypothetical protein
MVSITWGVITLPLKRNLISRFSKGGESIRNDEWYIDQIARRILGIRIDERRKTSQSLMQLSLRCIGDISPCRIGPCFKTLVVVCFITWSSWSSDLSGCSEWKRTFSNLNVKDNITHWGKNFQTESILGAIRDDILLNNQTQWVHEGMGEIMMTWLKIGLTPSRVLKRLSQHKSTIRAEWL